MTEKVRHRPIGVFDSGLGGLTVVREIRKILPAEDIVYLGDSARLPYGTKSKRQIVQFSLNNVRFLKQKNIKALVIACNSSSANAYYALRRRLSIPVIDVIRPASHAACQRSANGKIGVIGTSATIQSGAYQKEIHKINPRVKVYACNCPLFVPLVEEGWISNRIARSIVDTYLAKLIRKGIDTLILGCTHYPLLKGVIAQRVGRRVRVVDSGPSAAHLLAHELRVRHLARQSKRRGTVRLYVTDLSPHFVKVGERFLNHKLRDIRVVQL